MNSFFRIISGLFLLALMSACGGGGGSPGATSKVALFTTAPTSINVIPGQPAQIFTIGGGVPGYTAASSNTALIVNVSGNTLSISANGTGSATVTVTDTAGTHVTIAVTIGTGLNLYTSAAATVNVGVGISSAAIQIGGGSSIYAVTSSNTSIANVSQITNANTFTIVGIASGTAVVTVTDSLGASVKITVTVGTVSGNLTTTASNAINVAVGVSSVYTVQGGAAPYSVGSSNTSVVTANIVGGQLTVTGVAIGQATITVLDSSTQSTTISVQVGSSSKLFTTAPAALTLGTQTVSSTFTIGGGSQLYSISSSNNSVATASINGNSFIISGMNAGSASVTVTDTAGNTVVISVTVAGSSTTPLFTTAPSAVTLSAGGASTTYVVSGGTAPYTAVSSNTSVLTSTISGSNMQLTGVASGSATVTIKDATGAPLPVITVTVSGGSSNALYTTAPSAVQIAIGAGNAPQYQIFGGVPTYTVVSSATSIATVALSGNTFTVTGVAAGTANIVVTDSTGLKPITIAVTVGSNVTIPFYTSTPGAVTLTVGTTPPAFLLGGGTAPYTASSSNTSVVTTAVSGGSLTLTPVSPGTATVTLVDSAGSTPLSTNVTVVASNIQALTVAPSSISSAYVGDILTFNVNGGSPPYSVISSNPASVTINNGTSVPAGGTFTATMANTNNSVGIVVTDSKGNTQTVNIGTIGAKLSSMSLTPVAWSIFGNNSSSISLNLIGGIAPFQVFSTSPTQSNVALLSSVVVTNNGVALLPTQPPFFTDRTLTINLGTQGKRCVAASTPITFTVKDSVGTAATSTMTIVPNSGACP
ncbi:beta strand repeat-containing protein [Undibacterium sp. SXout11W]|uniref:beta strand repeat-containing protein n=1 Tax=Undibacterium sp. SXout11W TaxID=3413050 RepID=UPI003BF44CA8